MRTLLKIFAFCILVVALAAGYAIYSFTHAGPLTESKTLVFPKGSGFQMICDTLQYEGVIPSSFTFKMAAALLKQNGRFKAGEYAFPAGITPQGVMEMLAEGKTVIRKFTLAEGLTVREARALLEKDPSLSGELPADIPEGSLLPETYHYSYGDARADIVERMRVSLRQVLQEQWEKRQPGLPLKDPREALTLASIVEKETGIPSERGQVASVYLNRLKIGMKLQADPTTRYAIEQAEGAMTRPLLLSDLKRELPYNTYVIDGLPPGPIANPGRASIEAVLNPPQTQDIYFVATGNGGHRFAKTLAEHEANVQRLRKVQAEQRGK